MKLMVEGELDWTDDGGIRIEFALRGEIKGIALAERASSPARRDELWKATCFECFLQNDGDEAYTEINVAPSGDWNCYRFDRYREGMRPGEYSASVQSEVETNDESLRFQFVVPPACIPAGERPLAIGITLVVLGKDERVAHWALNHPRSHPDFHDASGFVLKLPRPRLT